MQHGEQRAEMKLLAMILVPAAKRRSNVRWYRYVNWVVRTCARCVRTSKLVRDVAKVKSPCRKTNAGYLNSALNSQPISARLTAFYLELHGRKHSSARGSLILIRRRICSPCLRNRDLAVQLSIDRRFCLSGTRFWCIDRS